MLKIVYPNCCGIDVHKTFVLAVIAITDEHGVTQYFRHRFSTFTKGLGELKQWLEYYSCTDVCMESTSKYWIPVYNVLEDSCSICFAHPKYVKAIRGKKTDKKDAKWIADLFKHDLVAGSFIPPLPIRELRDLVRYHFKLTNFCSSEANRLQNSLTVSNITLSSVLSDVLGVSGSRIIDAILEKPTDEIDLSALIHGRLKSKLSELELAIDGKITDEQAIKIRIIKSHYDALTLCKSDLEKAIIEVAEEFKAQQELIQTVPGCANQFTAIKIISEIGVDMWQFPTAGHLCSWAGLTPTNNESANKKKSVRISKAGHYLKPLLVQIANGIAKSEKYPEHRNKYLQLKKRRGHKKAIIAIARRLLTAIYHVLLKVEPYDSSYYSIEVVQPNRVMTINEAVSFAKSHGFVVS
ncbi:IS110 family transposase [Enterococcus faecalis]|uniref:IS110 family transposase n=1 Tax=Enterococcus faecalis TaxID=1351 RepID=UPI000CF11BAC|nr:IS110 family transposase [Enterococcus faecalis]EGO2635459.1 IS110 family transposase [Enterococcus faecalis]EGO8962754.1 IS110 family transposase [Enterococcus faecalis]EGO9273810.1 IS110 family transposase [Enterococcus faecalis]EGS8307570.1 IS110 family transposase [Enterococcus faecalis]EHH1618229.1 IS110 family transposase [Enterococcus faecalis]